ncbi:PAS domain S-box protein [Shewanella sp.]|uniref:PAS domain S-box protein n=1 Tax=Shewanella sp. TaxID=50422 RepID=UPI0040483BDE
MMKKILLRLKPSLYPYPLFLLLAFFLMLFICHLVYMKQVEIIKDDITSVSEIKLDKLQQHLDELKREVHFLANLPSVKQLASLSLLPTYTNEKKQLELEYSTTISEVFKQYATSIPGIVQIRYIDNKTGLEVIRINKLGDDVIVVPSTSLQYKGDRDYVIETRKLKRTQTFISDISLNQENGNISLPYLPVIRASTLVYDINNQEALGQIVINMSAESIFDDLQSELLHRMPKVELYVINEQGDYLLHPDKEKTFGFEHGIPYRLQDEFTIDNNDALLPVEYHAIDSLYPPFFFSRQDIELDINQQRQVGIVVVASNLSAIHKVSVFILWYWTAGLIFFLLLRMIKNNLVLKSKQLLLNTATEMEVKLLSILDNVPNGIILVNRNGIITMANGPVENIFGYHSSELIGQSVQILLPIHFQHSHAQNIDAYFARPETKLMGVGRDLYGVHKLGHNVPLEIGLSVMDYQGELHAICGIVDISKRKRLEVLFEQVVDVLPNAVLLTDLDGNIELVNHETEKLFGYERHLLLSKNINVLVSSSYQEQHFTWLKDIFESEDKTKTARQDMIGLRSDESEFPLSISLSKLATHKGDKLLYSVIDLTEREAKAHAMTKLSETLDRTSKMAGVGGWELDLETNELFYSDETYHIYGLPVGTKLSVEESIHFYTAEFQPIIQKTLSDAIETGKPWDIEVQFTNAEDKLIWVRVMGTIEYKNGKPIKVAGTIQDISERKYFIEELSRSNSELHNFAYVASHDLKSPLRGIDQLASWLEEDLKGKLTSQDAEHLSLMRGRINRMEQLLDDLLAYSRAGKKDDISDIDLVSVIENVFDLCNTHNTFTIETHLAVSRITTASVPLEQVLRNLINNAIKHHHTGKGKIEITVTVQGEFYEFIVNDDGPGIPAEFADKIFDMFTTLKPRDEVEGSGMGLAIVKKIIRTVEGDIKLDTGVTKGASFRFTWPVKLRRRH